ncbi:MAG: hypothetical protein ACREEM_56025 [Blastocatellia bacterium]
MPPVARNVSLHETSSWHRDKLVASGKSLFRQALRVGFLFALLACALCLTITTRAQETRRIWDSDLFKSRAKAPATARRRYRIATPRIPPDQVNGDTVLGITLWRLRPSRETDDKQVRLLKHAKDNTPVREWTPERIDAGTPLKPNQRVKLSVEAARTGYLYIVDRELYADGSLGDPYLIFPTQSIRNGDNQVAVGKIFDIPNDESYFNLEPSRDDQVGEIITVIVAPQPLEGFQIGEKEVRLPKELVASWEKAWGARTGRLDLENAAGKTLTKEERDAATGARPLQADSPAPQSLYYRPGAMTEDPLLASVRLRYGSVKTAPQHRRR